jgi:hypothetical protein
MLATRSLSWHAATYSLVLKLASISVTALPCVLPIETHCLWSMMLRVVACTSEGRTLPSSTSLPMLGIIIAAAAAAAAAASLLLQSDAV